MERRKAVIAAATATLTLLAGAAAISLNTSLVGASGDDGVGRVSPVDTATTPETIYIDEPAAGQVPVRSGDDDEFDDDHEDGQERNDDHGSGEDEHEYEGADDDD